MIIREITFEKSDISGLTNLMNQWDDLPAKISNEEILMKVAAIKRLDTKSAILVAESDGVIVGYAYLTEVIFLGLESFVELQSILVDVNHRRRGTGKLLLTHAESWTVNSGFGKLALSSRIQLQQSHEFYKNMGYKIYKQSYFFSKNVTRP
ncbi:MAG TPA: hypothetical protein DCO75_03570 [Fibrobacteres bacterium]|jgi:GNAT superfamily N-acetyltransferase|nr:hypothetical protein [Fibrobacterota bacterium]